MATPITEPRRRRRAVSDSSDYILRSLLAGGVAGCVAKTAVAPMDRVKILFQGHNRTYAQHRGTYSGSFHVLHHIAQTEGINGLFKGHSAMLIRIFPYAAINFMAFEQFKLLLAPGEGQQVSHVGRLLSGSAAGTVSVLFTYPLDLIRTRLAFQVKKQRYTGIGHTISTMVRNEGVLSLYKGFAATVAGILPYAGVSFYTYDSLKIFLRGPTMAHRTMTPEGDLMARYQLAAGAIAGLTSQTAAYPLDVIRRRMQLEGMAKAIPKYSGIWSAFRTIVHTEGYRGLFVGLSINYIKVTPAVSLSFATYEFMKKKLKIV